MIETSLNKIRYLGNGATTVFPVPFQAPRAEFLHLILSAGGKDSVLAGGYRVTGANTFAVAVELDVPLESGAALTILRLVPYIQPTSLQNGGDFNADVVEWTWDWLEMQIQQLREEVDRAVKVDVSYDSPPMSANEYLRLIEDLIARAEDAAADAREQVKKAETQVGKAEAQAKFSASSADRSCLCADEAAGYADAAREAVKNIPGFARHVHAFFGLRVDEHFRLMLHTSEDGDILHVSDFDLVEALPVEARFFMKDGGLKLELPFTL